MNFARLIVLVSVVLLPVSSRAGDIPTSYLVDAAALKQAPAGTSLTFELYSDSSCTSLVDSSAHLVEDVLLIGLKLVKPAGAPKPPKVVEMRKTISSVSVIGHAWLKVSGTGVSPIGPACQPQAAIGNLTASCFDATLNQDESDVDCGGTICGSCALGDNCLSGSDCETQRCLAGVCVESCFDGIKNQGETDVDCGGSGNGCPLCANDLQCLGDTDCLSNRCYTGICSASCFDGIKNQDETDVDCGGYTCGYSLDLPCAVNEQCLVDSDCTTDFYDPYYCVGSVCIDRCNDGIKNQDEGDVDCGGLYCHDTRLCVAGQTCQNSGDCVSGTYCNAGVCYDPF